MTNFLIKNALRDKGMSQKELATALKCSEPLISQLVGGGVKPTYQRARDLERVLGIPTHELMTYGDVA